MAKKKSDLLSVFEETCLWMSWRYAIGRNSIATVTHAHDIAVNTFWRQTIDRKEFNAFDIAREIENQLIYPFNFHVEYPNANQNYHPLEKFFEFLKNENIYDLDELNRYKSIRCDIDGNFKIERYQSNTDGSEQTEYGNPNPRHHSAMDIDDLIPWQMLAAAFDVKRLLVVHTVFNGKEEDIICFKSYEKNYARTITKDLQGNDYEINDIHNYTYDEKYVPLDKYLAFGGEHYRINPEYIVSIRQITDEEAKQFEVE